MNMLSKRKIKIFDLLFLYNKMDTQKVYQIYKNKVSILCILPIENSTQIVYCKDG